MKVAVISVPNLPERQRKAVAHLAARICPPDSFPHAAVLAGIDEPDHVLEQDAATAAWWVGPGEADGLLRCSVLARYLAAGVRIVVLTRNHSDASLIATALRARAAA
jgi:hypothetical protein